MLSLVEMLTKFFEINNLKKLCVKIQTIATTSNKLFKMSTKLICCLCNVHLAYMDNLLENSC